MTRRHLLLTTALVVAGVLGFQLGRQGPNVLAPDAVRRPVIGIASVNSETYVQAVREGGGIPVVLPPSGGKEAISGYLEFLDGLLMPGGLDIPPAEYGEEVHPTVEPLGESRYQFERQLGKAWMERTDKPLLGICLGSQWINVLHGGTLVQDIPSELGGNHRGTNHLVTLEADSRLGRIFGETEFEVNSNHHQAVGDLGKGLRIVARSPDGVVEATETTDPDRFLLGVQWHPERMIPDDPRQIKLLKAFIEAAAVVKERP